MGQWKVNLLHILQGTDPPSPPLWKVPSCMHPIAQLCRAVCWHLHRNFTYQIKHMHLWLATLPTLIAQTPKVLPAQHAMIRYIPPLYWHLHAEVFQACLGRCAKIFMLAACIASRTGYQVWSLQTACEMWLRVRVGSSSVLERDKSEAENER